MQDMTTERSPPFCSQIRASGLGEVWTHTHDDLKFGQYGWRCTTKENSYSTDSLIGNWNEEKFDITKQNLAKRLPSQYEHYFDSTYKSSYDTRQSEVPQALKHLKERHPHSHPGHQPELDHPSLTNTYNSWETTSRSSYMDPRIRRQPVQEAITTPTTDL